MSTRKAILVTGANGLLGRNLCELLLAQNHLVVAVVRNTAHMPLQHPHLQVVSQNSVQVLSGCDVVIHCAALTAQHLHKRDAYREVNTRQTQRLMMQCVQAGVRRFIYVSTANTIGHGKATQPGTETSEMRDPFTRSHYAVSKAEAEQLMHTFTESLEVVCVNPGFMLGPYVQPNGSGRLVKAALGKKILWYPPGSKSILDVRDAAHAIINSITEGMPGTRYLLTGPTYTYREVYQRIQQLTSNKALLLPVPAWALYLAGIWGSLKHLLRADSVLTLTNMRILCTQVHYNNQRAKSVLNLHVRPLNETLESAIQTLKHPIRS